MRAAKRNYVKAGVIGDMLDVDAGTIRRWARQRKIPAMKLPNGRFVFDIDAVIAAVEKHRLTILSPNRRMGGADRE